MKWLEKHPWDHSRRIDSSGQLFTANSNLWDSEMHGCNEMILPYIFIIYHIYIQSIMGQVWVW